MLSRRHVTFGLAASAFGLQRALADGSAALGLRIADIEKQSGGRLGVAVLDVRAGTTFQHRGDERFPLCSTFKLLAAAALLHRVDRGAEHLDRLVRYVASDIVPHAPETSKYVRDGMTLAAICKAAITLSDNTAGNLMLAALGGSAGLTGWVRTLGDEVTRLDRREIELNEARPGDPRDTTTPVAMRDDMRKILLGDVLSNASRRQLAAWLTANETGGTRLKAGLPANWTVGDKTGAGDRGATNDVAIVHRPDGAPLIVTAYLTETAAPVEARNAALAAVGRAIAIALAA